MNDVILKVQLENLPNDMANVEDTDWGIVIVWELCSWENVNCLNTAIEMAGS